MSGAQKPPIEILRENSDKEFVNRIFNPASAPPSIKNPDGSVSTHLMAAEVDENGNWFAFPTIVNDGGSLRKFDDPFEALKFGMDRGEVIEFGKNKEAAINFAINYKKGTPLE